jgi:hypothetical protein
VDVVLGHSFLGKADLSIPMTLSRTISPHLFGRQAALGNECLVANPCRSWNHLQAGLLLPMRKRNSNRKWIRPSGNGETCLLRWHSFQQMKRRWWLAPRIPLPEHLAILSVEENRSTKSLTSIGQNCEGDHFSFPLFCSVRFGYWIMVLDAAFILSGSSRSATSVLARRLVFS